MMMMTLDQTIQLKNIAIFHYLCVLKRRGTFMSENSPLIQPTLQHFGVLTGHLERMVDWYAKVVGMTTRYSTSREVGASVTFLSFHVIRHAFEDMKGYEFENVIKNAIYDRGN